MTVRLVVILVPAIVAAGALAMIARGLFAPTSPTAELRRRAQRARVSYHEVLRLTLDGPLRERLEEIGRSVDEAAVEADRVAQIVAAAGTDGSAARRLDQIVATLERAVVVAGELAVTGHDVSQELDLELDVIDAALRELGDGG